MVGILPTGVPAVAQTNRAACLARVEDRYRHDLATLGTAAAQRRQALGVESCDDAAARARAAERRRAVERRGDTRR
ncbi:MAG: hypothetical protein SF002_17505 [Alphaproteobacteria bacterium]|nr:hypothetical protein [Alphaproteobacteria bacterium]